MSSGGVRRLDAQGRLVINAGVRRQLGFRPGDYIEFLVEGEQVILRKAEPCCVFCGGAKDLAGLIGKTVCADCAAKLSKHNIYG